MRFDRGGIKLQLLLHLMLSRAFDSAGLERLPVFDCLNDSDTK
jgi:hypothetical protein